MTDLKIYGEHDERTVSQMWRCMGVGSVAGGVLCADGHLGYAQPVGGVIAYEDHVSISGVGFDIACGNMAARINLKYEDIKDRVPVIANDIGKRISFGLGRSNPKPIDHAVFDSPLWEDAGVGHLKEMARAQLGTVGSGNHYVDLFEDEDGYVWIGVHFGSRGLGHKSATHYLKLAGGKDGMDVAPTVAACRLASSAQRYLAAMTLAGEYAYAGREWVVEQVRLHPLRQGHRHRAQPPQLRLAGAPRRARAVGGAQGRDAGVSRPARLCRRLDGRQRRHPLGHRERGRRAEPVLDRARRRPRDVAHPGARPLGEGPGKTGKRVRQQGRVRHDEMQAWLREKGVHLVGGDLDEAPQAYRRLPDVLAHHAGTIKIEHTLRPFIVVMAGADVFDPFKD